MGYIESTLSGDEKIMYKFSFHWIRYVIPLLSFITVFLIPVGLYLILRLLFVEQGVTSKKCLLKEGIISRKTEELLLSKIETVEIKQSVLGRLLGYGNIHLTGTGSSDVVFKTVVSPMKVKNNIEGLLNN